RRDRHAFGEGVGNQRGDARARDGGDRGSKHRGAAGGPQAHAHPPHASSCTQGVHAIFTASGPTFTPPSRPASDTRNMKVLGPETGRDAIPAATRGRRALPPSPGYALKRMILGPALPTSRLAHERLGKPTALAVFASDNLSSSAYATEEILKVAVPAVGGAAFALVMPITFAILCVLAILLFSYRQTIRAYPSAGGAYIVTKDNFGLLTAQLAGVALLTDYVLTVSVSDRKCV